MIILFHDGKESIKYLDTKTGEENLRKDSSIQKSLFFLSKTYPNKLLLWCNILLKENINFNIIKSIFHHHLIFASYSTTGEYSISKNIGFVDQHCFINVKKNVQYPTWLMSDDIGGAYASVIRKSEPLININQSFSVFLSSFAKLSMPKGLLCYSSPKLLLNNHIKIESSLKYKNLQQYNFIKQHYKKQWLFVQFIIQLFYNKRFHLFALINSLFFKKRYDLSIDFNDIEIKSTKQKITKEDFTVDVLIPTLGRKEHLHKVLIDLSNQTLLPKKIIIVEQNGDETSSSELDYLGNHWPFEIDHTFTYQLGACNARNIALSKVTSDWVFFADDDIRFEKDLLEKLFIKINELGTSCIVMSCLQKKEKQKKIIIAQSEHFGSGTSLVKSDSLKKVNFKSEHEFGYGEDSDFGMQLRNNGTEIVSVPQITMLHLKAPAGGFRLKVNYGWSQEIIQPKPSPTVMAYNLKHLTKEQLISYKLLLFLKFYTRQTIKNPIKYFKVMNKKWYVSVYWAKKMIKDEF